MQRRRWGHRDRCRGAACAARRQGTARPGHGSGWRRPAHRFRRIGAAPGAGPAIAAALGAACCYAIASTYAKSVAQVEPFANAHGSMWAATLLVFPLLPFAPVAGMPDIGIAGAVMALGIVCSGIAYLLYFRLVNDLGPAPALTVTFLIPVFGVLWGHLFLDETIGWHTLPAPSSCSAERHSSPASRRRRCWKETRQRRAEGAVS